ncbi:VOC family protein [Paracoccus sp. PAR01]|uniref:VOC family protein n=1 Tax=Paracoccus sp. PAR01 TaxID=2769282 RepID=UPI00177FB3D4|nr:VOC family protein [Paracoccus sp. PAR01]MBD9529534.1 VOC family protein [Paracoccus sp. PAR01]
MTISKRRIDHLVLAVQDLDAAGAFYERLGFQVGARNRHPWGTENRIVQFRSSFLELITVGEDRALIPPHANRHFSFGAFVRDYLENRQGLAMFVLDSADAEADAAHFARARIGDYEPFFFERKGRRPDGSEARVAFTLAFSMAPDLPEVSFFTCQQHYPEAFWNPSFQIHANGASNVRSVTLNEGETGSHTDFLSSFTGAEPLNGGRCFPFLNGGRLERVTCAGPRGFTSFSVGVPELGGLAERLQAEHIPFEMLSDRISIDSEAGFGVAIEFEVDGPEFVS